MQQKKLFAVALTLVATISLMARTAEAQVARAHVVQSDTSVDGYVTSDILLDFAGQYTGSQMIVELTGGSIFQDGPPAGATPPSSALIDLPTFPNLRWDTFLANGGPTAESGVGNFGLGGAAINADPDFGGGTTRSPAFSGELIDQSWNPAGGNVIEDQDGFMVARLTLSNDAQGTLKLVASANQIIGIPEIVTAAGTATGGANGVSVPIVNGVIGGGEVIIPEPSTFVLLGLGLIGLVALKRRNG